MSNKASAIRQALKEIGYNQRQVSVKDRPGGYSYSFTLTIRDASVIFDKVEQVGKSFQRVDRCEASGEILSGGNTFVHVSITDEVREAWASEFVPKLEEAIKELQDDNHGKKVNERFIVFKHNTHIIKIWDEIKRNWLDGNYSIRDFKAMAVDLHCATVERAEELKKQISDSLTDTSVESAANWTNAKKELETVQN